MFNRGLGTDLSATDQAVKPGDYAIGSPQSRAAARAKLELNRAARLKDGLDVVVVSVGKSFFGPTHELGKWEDHDGQLVRVSRLPSGLSIEEADRIVARAGARNLAKEWNMRQTERP